MTTRPLPLLLCATALLLACSSGAGGGGLDSGLSESDVAIGQDAGGGGDSFLEEDVAAGSRTVFFTVGSSAEVTRGANSTFPLQVVDLVASRPAAGVLVHLALTSESEGADASLQDETLVTGEDGTAEAVFSPGTVVPAIYELRATVAGADEAALFTIRVVPREEGEGDLRVTFEYVDEVPVAALTVVLYEGLDCAGLDPIQPPTGAGSQQGDDVEGSVLFSQLDTAPSWTVLALADDEEGRRFAAGCLEGIRLAADLEVPVRVSLLVLPVALDGDYDLSVALDLAVIAAALAAPQLAALADLLDDEGYCLSRGVAGVVRTLRPAVFEALSPEAQAELVNTLAAAAAAYTAPVMPGEPTFAAQMDGMAAAVAAAFADVRLEGALTLAASEGSIVTSADVVWQRAALAGSGGALWLTADELAALPHPFTLTPSIWSSHVFAFDRLDVSAFTIALDVALLLRHFLDALYPSQLGAPSPADYVGLAARMHDCAIMAPQFVADAALGAYGITQQEFAEGCAEALRACYVRDIERAEADTLAGTSLRVFGTASLVVAPDLSVTSIEGSLGGSVETTGGAGGSLSGSWTASRR